MYFTCVAFGAVFIILGVSLFFGLVHTHLSGWKATPEEEKAQIDIKGLCRNAGSVITLAGVITLAAGLNQKFRETYFVWLMIAWIIFCAVDVYQMGKKDRYKIKHDMK